MLRDLRILVLVTLCFYQVIGISSDRNTELLLENRERLVQIYYKNCLLHTKCDLKRRPVIMPFNKTTCCRECSCDDTCVQHNEVNCCPDIIDSLMANQTQLSPEYVCAFPTLRKKTNILDKTYALPMFRSCSSSFKNETVRQFCLDYSKERNMSLNDMRPVTFEQTTYFNVYCAICNGLSVSNVTPWLPGSVVCGEGYFVPEDEEHLMKHIWNTDCDVLFSLPPGVNPIKCDVYISRCNTTGLWSNYDPSLEEACQTFFLPYNDTYRNIFCYLCNEVQVPTAICPVPNSQNIEYLSFSAVLNFDVETVRENDSSSPGCADDHVYDRYQMKCLQLRCFLGRRNNNGTCGQSLLGEASGLCLLLSLKLTPQKRISNELVSTFGDALRYNIWNQFQVQGEKPIGSVAGYRLFYENETQTGHYIKHFLYELAVVSMNYPFSVFIADVLQLDGTTHVYSIKNETFRFSLELVGNRVKKEQNMFFSLTGETVTLLTEKVIHEKCITNLLVITHAMECPLIELFKTVFTWTFTENGIFIRELDLHVPTTKLMEGSDDSSILICAEIYLKKATKIALERDRAGTMSIAAYLTFVCVILSVCCLIVTIVTYGLFPTLRTQPGLNNVILAFSLIVAQCFFQFGIGAKEDVPNWACVCLGILIHFSWLFVVFWMNVCSVHMARVFGNTNQQHSDDHKMKTCLVYLAYVFAITSFFVTVNITVSHLTSDGDSWGYADGEECYISNKLMLGVTFALPVGLVVIVNCVLFLFVVCKICRMPDVPKANQKNKNLLGVYTRLSTITGLTWSLGFIYALTGVDVFEYLFAVLNAGQGIFIMLAFVMNKRVHGMYKVLFCGKVKQTTNEASKIEQSVCSSQRHLNTDDN